METLNKKLTIVGLGKLGGLLAEAFIARGLILPEEIVATVRHAARARILDKKHPFPVHTDNEAATFGADIVLLAVKPQVMEGVCETIRGSVSNETLIISILAGVPNAAIERFFPGGPVIRAMPNTPCAVGSGMTVLCRGAGAGDDDVALAERLFDTVGRTVVMDERHMNAVTGLSASGPAYIYVILESLAEAGVKLGLPRETATLLAAQTAKGAAEQVLATGAHPALLKDEVTTPAGCTIDGLLELEEGKLRVTLIKAVVKAAERAKELFTDSAKSDQK